MKKRILFSILAFNTGDEERVLINLVRELTSDTGWDIIVLLSFLLIISVF